MSSPPEGPGAADARELGWRPLWNRVRFPLLIFAVWRITFGLIGWIGLSFAPELTVPGGERPLQPWLFLDAMFRWDCGWYSRIATEGYSERAMANFWPLLPALTRFVAAFGPTVQVAQILVASAFQLGALIVLYELFKRVTTDTTARWGVALYAAFPFAFFQAVPYPEGMMTFFSAGAVLAALSRRPFITALLLGLSVLSRHLGGFTALALVVVLWREAQSRPTWRRVMAIWPVLSVPLVVGAWAWFLNQRFGEPLAFVNSRQLWGSMAYWSIFEWSAPRTHLEHHVYIVLSFLLAFGALPLLRRPEHRGLAIMSIGTLALLWMVGVAALGRYSSSVWPLFLGLGIAAEKRPEAGMAVVAASLALQAIMFHFYAHQWWIF
ncbi:MAG: hypothetical protein IT380_10600 [Myxococcales bacterium]|nr:hypothetical protein [Myxococcales bacterium]